MFQLKSIEIKKTKQTKNQTNQKQNKTPGAGRPRLASRDMV